VPQLPRNKRNGCVIHTCAIEKTDRSVIIIVIELPNQDIALMPSAPRPKVRGLR
jgi:hypothetical protein